MNKNGHGFANQFDIQIIKGKKVVFDSASGLMWQQAGSARTMNYEEAIKWMELSASCRTGLLIGFCYLIFLR